MTTHPFKLRKLKTINFYEAEQFELDWVGNDDKISNYIGIRGTNGNYKSGFLTRAFPWLLHPEAFPMESKDGKNCIAEGCHSLTVEAEIEWRGKIYLVKRILYHDNNQSKSLYLLKDGEEKNSVAKWDEIFGRINDNHGFIFDSDRLIMAHKNVANEENADDFSDNLGHKPIISSLDKLITDIDLEITGKTSSVLSAEERMNYDTAITKIKDLEERITEQQGLKKKYSKVNESFEDYYGDEFEYFQGNQQGIDIADGVYNTAKNNYYNHKNNLARYGIIQNVCFRNLENYLKSYNIEKQSLENDGTSEKRDAALMFEDAGLSGYLTTDEDKLLELKAIKETQAEHRLDWFCETETPNLEEDLHESLTFYNEMNKKKLDLDNLQNDSSSGSNSINKTDFDTWKAAKLSLEHANKEIDSLKKQLQPFNKIKKKFEASDTSKTEILELKKKKLLYKLLKNSIETTILSYQKSCIERMIERANQILKDVDPNLNAELKLEDDKIVPYLDGKRRPLSLIDKHGGPSKGEGLKINTSIMISRYLETNSPTPILLDDSLSHVDYSAKHFIKRFLEEIDKVNGQMIWINKFVPPYTGHDLKLINLPNKKGSPKNLEKPPWNGKKIIAVDATESQKIANKEENEAEEGS